MKDPTGAASCAVADLARSSSCWGQLPCSCRGCRLSSSETLLLLCLKRQAWFSVDGSEWDKGLSGKKLSSGRGRPSSWIAA